jgi:hypothetical protein
VGEFQRDVIGLEGERAPEGSRPLLQPIVENGLLLHEPDGVKAIKARATESLAALPERYEALAVGPEDQYPVEMTPALQALRDGLIHDLMEKER